MGKKKALLLKCIARRSYAAVVMVVGLALAGGGALLVGIGGSFYYVVAGVATVISGFLIWTNRPRGVELYWCVLLGTVVWAVWEVGFNGWALVPRVIAPFVLGIGLLFLRHSTRKSGEVEVQRLTKPGMRVVQAGGSFVLAILIGAGLHALSGEGFPDPAYQRGTTVAGPARVVGAAATGDDWSSFGGDQGGNRFSRLAQINPANVSRLKVAWTFRVGETPKHLGGHTSLEVTPLKVGDTVYVCTGYSDVIALDAETGKQRWRFRSGVDIKEIPVPVCRGLVHFRTESSSCPDRIITNTLDLRLIALDARTGQLCKDFGTNGVTSLKMGMEPLPPGYYYHTSAPTLARGNVVLGGWVFDNQFWGEPSGVIRAFNATTGQLAWAWDMGRPDRKTAPPNGERYTPSTPNNWSPMAADEKLGLVYLPMGGSPPDHFGGYRRPFDEKYGSAVVALDAGTGDVRWSFQTVHHDLWDYDIASQPALVDLTVGGKQVPALIQATKRGQVFLLNRVTGQPLATVQEKAVPKQGGVSEDRLSPTQPYSTGLPAFGGPRLAERDMWGISPLDQLWCRIIFRQTRYEGEFTPLGTTPSLIYPGYMGGSNWGSVSVDRSRNILVLNTLRLATRARLIPRAEADKQGIKPIRWSQVGEPGGGHPWLGAQASTPYGVELKPFLSPLGVPCQQPPYGVLSAVDLNSRKLLWTKPFGSARESGPFGTASQLPITVGTPAHGGSITTAAGLLFIGATQDGYLRAFDTATGRLLWEDRLPAGGNATPATYVSPESGRQFVVIAAGGMRTLQSREGDYIVAYALPD
jgi:quinoprotein glucose dehydrogenase